MQYGTNKTWSNLVETGLSMQQDISSTDLKIDIDSMYSVIA